MIIIFWFRYTFRSAISLNCILLAGCSLISKPDSCNYESHCKLISSDNTKVVELIIDKPISMDICACRSWNKSGIQVLKGQQYVFELEKVDNWKDGKIQSNPVDGWEDNFSNAIGFIVGFLKRSDKTNWYALVGTIGVDDKDTFAVFKNCSEPVTMNKSGLLYFYANDKKGRYFNNQGTLQLRVTRKK